MSNEVQSGLAALFPPLDMETVPVEPVNIRSIEDVIVSPSSELVASMDMRGQLQPITLTTARTRPIYGVVDGRRRLAAARQLGWSTIRAQILDLDPLAEAATAIMANAIRSDNPLSDIVAIQELTEHGYSEAEIAAATGLRVGTIRKRKKLLSLPKDLWNGVASGRIAIGVGQQIAGATSSVQEEMVEILDEKGRVTGPDLREATSAVRQSAAQQIAELMNLEPEPRDRADDFRDELHDLVARYAGEIDYDELMICTASAWESVRGEVEDDQ